MNKILRYIQLYYNPPKKGDVFFRDPQDFMLSSNFERILFPMMDRHGQMLYHFLPFNNSYRFTVESTGMPYYICGVEILVSERGAPSNRCWLKRSQPRRIWKKDFHRLIAEGRMVKTQSQSLFK